MACSQRLVSFLSFSFLSLAPYLASGDKAMENDQSNKRRQVLLLRLSQTAAEDNNPEIASWCETQQEKVLRCLSKLDSKQIPWLMELSQSRGAEFLRDV
jgi:hypothetical protein